ncbi:MAG TPA: dolichyl-phosphate beta-glucosyltransferase [Anaerolineae bacterium]|nr:dolichyl-phosphate beta-glucosyltransferase [Anaerolineae bacterium]
MKCRPLRGVTISTQPFLSIVIPAHNEEHRLPPSLEKIAAFLARQSYTSEVIVVENGSVDRTADVAQDFAATHPGVTLIQEEQRGKGIAVRHGMLAARGEYRFICDADLSMPIEEVNKFLPPALDGYDVAIGSREAPGARRYNEPLYRHLMGRLFTAIVKLLAVRGFEDTQCGFKCFRADVARDLFSVQRLNGMSFDVEALFIAQRRGYKIVEVPINWYFSAESRVRLIDDSLRMVGELLEVRRNWRRGAYERVDANSSRKTDGPQAAPTES